MGIPDGKKIRNGKNDPIDLGLFNDHTKQTFWSNEQSHIQIYI